MVSSFASLFNCTPYCLFGSDSTYFKLIYLISAFLFRVFGRPPRFEWWLAFVDFKFIYFFLVFGRQRGSRDDCLLLQSSWVYVSVESFDNKNVLRCCFFIYIFSAVILEDLTTKKHTAVSPSYSKTSMVQLWFVILMYAVSALRFCWG